jgi:hypothetical protein
MRRLFQKLEESEIQFSYERNWTDRLNLWDAVRNAIGYARFSSRSHNAVIRVYGEAGNENRDARASGRVQRVVSFLSRRGACFR